MEKIKTSVSLDKDVYEKVKEMSEKEVRNFSQQVNKILRDYLRENEK